MEIKYLGPSPSVNVGGFGPHFKGKVVNYPAEVAEELLETAKKQEFESVSGGKAEEKAKAEAAAKAKAEAAAKAKAEAAAKAKAEAAAKAKAEAAAKADKK